MSKQALFTIVGLSLILFSAVSAPMPASGFPMLLNKGASDTIAKGSEEKTNSPRITQALQEADSLYARFVAILNNVDIPERYEAVEDILQELWTEIATLESRYPDVDPDLLSEALFADKKFIQRTEEFDRQLTRIRAEMPTEGMRLDGIIEGGVHSSYEVSMDELVNNAVDLFEELVEILEAIKTAEDVEESYNALYELSSTLRQIEGDDSEYRDEFRKRMLASDYAVSLAQRAEAVLDSFDGRPEMRRVFEAIEPLDAEKATSAVQITPEQQDALAEFQILLEQSIILFSKLKTPKDVDRYADEIRTLAKKEQEVRGALPGSQGEMLIESHPELVKLLEKLGAEQMRIFEDPELSTKISTLFSGG